MCLWVNDNYKKLIDLVFPNYFLTGIFQLNFYHKCSKYQSYYNNHCKILSECIFKNDDFIFFENVKGKTKCPCYKNVKLDYENFKDIKYSFDDVFNINFLWETPILNGNYVIGIPDFTILINAKPYGEHIVDSEKGIFYRNLLFKWNTFKIIIEVKPKINSIGETMRQLKLYSTYMLSRVGDRSYANCIFLVTKNKEHKKVFESQGINYFVLTDEMMDGKNGNILQTFEKKNKNK